MTRKIALPALFLLSFQLAACDSKEKAAPAADVPATDAPAAAAAAAPKEKAAAADPTAEAAALYTSTCTVCHGASGAGDGPGAAAMDPKPRNLGDKEWLAKVTDEELSKVIIGGGMATGKSPLMPPNPGLKNKPDVVAALIKHIRAFGK